MNFLIQLIYLLGSGLMHAAHGTRAPQFKVLLQAPMATRLTQFKQLKPESYEYLSRAAFDKNNSLQTRWRAVTTMGRLDAFYFRKDLVRASHAPEWFVRNAALIAVQTDDHAQAVKWSVRALSDPALVVRTQAIRNLIQLEARQTEPVLWEQIFSAKNFRNRRGLWVRVHLAEALARFTAPGRSKGFQRLLQDEDERLHRWAILGLENTTGFKLSDTRVPLEIRRQQWLARLDAGTGGGI